MTPLKLAAYVIALFISAPAVLAEPEGQISGRPSVSDGDTFQFAIRLFGVDTPETQQVCADAADKCYRCGEGASKFVEELFAVTSSKRASRDVTCRFIGDVTFGRALASCEVDGKDVAEELIRSGWAMAYRRFPEDTPQEARYLSAEKDAETAGRGMWQGEFVTPSDWRSSGSRVVCSWNQDIHAE